MKHVMTWFEAGKDPSIAALADAVARRARWSQPDVLTQRNEIPAEICEVFPLFQERITHQAQDATLTVGPDVEFVAATVARIFRSTRGAGEMPGDGKGGDGPGELAATRSSREAAARAASFQQALEAAERVRTASDAHRHQIDVLRQAAVDAAHHLNVVLRRHHRFAAQFTFTLPETFAVDPAVYEIGLARVHAALDILRHHQTGTEQAAHTISSHECGHNGGHGHNHIDNNHIDNKEGAA